MNWRALYIPSELYAELKELATQYRVSVGEVATMLLTTGARTLADMQEQGVVQGGDGSEGQPATETVDLTQPRSTQTLTPEDLKEFSEVTTGVL